MPSFEDRSDMVEDFLEEFRVEEGLGVGGGTDLALLLVEREG